MSNRIETLEADGFERPFDESPIDTPGGWEYRGLMNVGGGLFSRIWRHKEENMELLYNMKDDGVTIIGAKHSPEEDGYVGDLDDIVASKEAGTDKFTEADLYTIAKELMESYPK